MAGITTRSVTAGGAVVLKDGTPGRAVSERKLRDFSFLRATIILNEIPRYDTERRCAGGSAHRRGALAL